MFASRITKTISVQGNSVTIRKLSASQLDEARDVRQLAVTSMAAKLGPDMVKAFRESAKEAGEVPSEPKPETPKWSYSDFDRATTLQKGIVSWDFKTDSGEKIPVNFSNVDDIEEEPAELIFKEIIDHSKKVTDPKAS